MIIGSPIPPNPGPIRKAIRFLDEYTSPRPDTAGNLDQPSYFQAAFNGAADGFYLFGPVGILSGAASASAGILAQRQSSSQALGVVAGAVVGATLGGAIGHFLNHQAATVGIVGGALLGGYETLRGDANARRRDSSNMLSTVFLHGPAKLAGSFGAMIGAHFDNVWAQTGTAALIGAATGAAVAALVPGGPGIVTVAAISAAGAAVGPLLGARLSQLTRNLSQDVGKLLAKAKPGEEKKPSSKLVQVMGTIPMAFVKEGIRGFFLSDGRWSAVALGGLKESARQVHIVLASHAEKS